MYSLVFGHFDLCLAPEPYAKGTICIHIDHTCRVSGVMWLEFNQRKSLTWKGVREQMDDVASTFISKVHGTNSATFATGCFLMRHLSFKKKEVDFRQRRGFVRYFVSGRPAGSLAAGRPAASMWPGPAGQYRVHRPAVQTGWLVDYFAV